MNKRTFGSIRKLPSGRYQARYRVLERGSQMFSAPHTFQTIKDADRWLAKEQTKLADGTWQPPQAVAVAQGEKVALTFKEYAKRVLARRKITDRTIGEYERLLEKLIYPKFGDQPLAAITPRKISDWHGSLKNTPAQQANAYVLVKSIFQDAINDELIDRSPCRVRAGSSKTRAKEPEVLTVKELQAYLAAIPEHYRMLFTILFWCGLRSGEVRALRRKDLDLAAGTLTIGRSVIKMEGRTIFKRPKTAAGIRTISLPPHLIKQLKRWLKDQPVKGQDALLFTAQDGESPLGFTPLWTAHNSARLKINRPGLTIHGLRHSAATLAAQNGASTAELQKRFGWDTPAMAAKYSHAAVERDKQLAKKLSKLV